MTTIIEQIELTVINCGECAGTYAINERYREKQYEKGGSWTCPYCKVSWGYSQNNLKSIQERKIKDLKRKAAALEAEKWQAEQEKKTLQTQYTKIRERVRNGVCPCCNRSFENLLKHIQTKHPEFGASNTLKTVRMTYGLTQAALADEVGVAASYISSMENGKPLPENAKDRLNEWLEKQA